MIFLLLLSSLVQAENAFINKSDFTITHPTCLVRFDETQEFGEKLGRKLKEKGYKTHAFLPEKKLNVEDWYFTSSIKREGMIYKDCTISYAILEAKSVRPASMDIKILEGSSKRNLPRVTFSGDERCTRAIDDLFVNIPTCRSGLPIRMKK